MYRITNKWKNNQATISLVYTLNTPTSFQILKTSEITWRLQNVWDYLTFTECWSVFSKKIYLNQSGRIVIDYALLYQAYRRELPRDNLIIDKSNYVLEKYGRSLS